MRNKVLKLLCIALIGLTGCYDYSNLENFAIDPFTPSYVLPVVKSKISFKEIAERSDANTVVEQRPGSNMYYLAFRDTIDLGIATEKFKIPPVSYNDNYQLDAGVMPPVFPANIEIGPFSKSYSQTFQAIAGSEIKQIDLSGGTLQISITNNFKHSIRGNIILNSLKNSSGDSIVLTFDLPYPVSGSNTYANTVNLNGDYLDLLNGSTYNSFKYTLDDLRIKSSGDLDLTGDIAIQLSMSDINFQKITGKINYSFIQPNQSYSIDIFNSTILASQHLAQPKFTMNFINSFGVPSSVNFTRLDVENNLGTILPIQNEGTPSTGDLLIGTPNSINYITAGQQSASTPLVLSYSNSNIEDVFDVAPRTLSFGATFNLGDATDNHDYFATSTSKFQLQSDIEIPLLGWVKTNEIADTISEMDWPDLNDLNIIDDGKTKITLKFKFSNELPLDMYLQAYFVDDLGLPITQLFDDGLEHFIKSAPVNATTGESSGTTDAYSYINMDRAKYDKISNSTRMVLIFKFNTGDSDKTPPQNITILSTNSIAINMSVEVTGTVKP